MTKLVATDAALCAGLHHVCFGASAWNAAQIAGSLELATTEGWLIFQNDEAAGFVMCQQQSGETEILTLCVSPTQRQRGLGLQLVRRVITAAGAQHSRKIFLDVAEDNVAGIALYRKAGFQRIGRRPDYYRRADGPVAALLYQLEL